MATTYNLATVNGMMDYVTNHATAANANKLDGQNSTYYASKEFVRNKVASKRVLVLGDSLSSEMPTQSESWPGILSDVINNAGVPVSVVNVAVAGHTFYRCYNEQSFHGRTQLQRAALVEDVDVILVALGFNDTYTDVDGRSLAQVKNDAQTVYSGLRQAHPDALIVSVLEQVYEPFVLVSNLKNRNVIPSLFNRIPDGEMSAAKLGTGISVTTQNDVQDWIDLVSYIDTLPEVDTKITLDLWTTYRLGAVGHDGLHPSAQARQLLAGCIYTEINNTAPLQDAIGHISGDFVPDTIVDPQALFNAVLVPVGSAYEPVLNLYGTIEDLTLRNTAYKLRLENWWAISGATLTTVVDDKLDGTIPIDLPFWWEISGATAFQDVYTKVQGGSWDLTGRTNQLGYFKSSGYLPKSFDNSDFYYRVGQDVLGPVTVKFSGSTTIPESGNVGSTRWMKFPDGTLIVTDPDLVLPYLTASALQAGFTLPVQPTDNIYSAHVTIRSNPNDPNYNLASGGGVGGMTCDYNEVATGNDRINVICRDPNAAFQPGDSLPVAVTVYARWY